MCDVLFVQSLPVVVPVSVVVILGSQIDMLQLLNRWRCGQIVAYKMACAGTSAG